MSDYLTQMMMLYWLQQTGNKPITLMGGGTGMVGDPSGKDETRKRCAPVEKSRPTRPRSRACFSKVLDFGDGADDALMVDNADWLRKLGYIEMLRDVGRHFSVNRMLAMDSVQDSGSSASRR
jgi:tyrosyl-tRNA synthetase